MVNAHLSDSFTPLPTDALLDTVERQLDTAHASAATLLAKWLAEHLANFNLSRHRIQATTAGLAVDGVPCRELAIRPRPVLHALRQAAWLVDQVPVGVLRHLAARGPLNPDCGERNRFVALSLDE